MDTGEGRMMTGETEEEVQEKLRKLIGPDYAGVMKHVFRVGDELTLEGSRFRICKLTPKKMTLRVLPRSG